VIGRRDVPDIEAEPCALEGVVAPEGNVGVYVGIADVGIEETCGLHDVPERAKVVGMRISLVPRLSRQRECQQRQRRKQHEV
jgi:hypothetical protein